MENVSPQVLKKWGKCLTLFKQVFTKRSKMSWEIVSSQDKNLPYAILTLSHFGFKYCSVRRKKNPDLWFYLPLRIFLLSSAPRLQYENKQVMKYVEDSKKNQFEINYRLFAENLSFNSFFLSASVCLVTELLFLDILVSAFWSSL